MEVDGIKIHCRDSLQYLGVVLDLRLSWFLHIKYMAGRALRVVGVLRTISGVTWGVSLSLLLLIFRGLVRAYLKWGAPLFLAAIKMAPGQS